MAVLPLDAPVEVELIAEVQRARRVAERPAGAVLRLPATLAGQFSDVLDGRKEPAAARDAATVLLLRPARPSGSDPPGPVPPGAGARPGAPGGTACRCSCCGAPGPWRSRPARPCSRAGRSTPGTPRSRWPGRARTPPRGAPAWTAPPALARALVCAAVRETFEETGVLLAGPTDATLVADTSAADWEADRQALLDHTLSLAGLLNRRGLVLRSDLLRPWARWITPEVEPRRYDTRFFAAALPPGQRTRHVGGEADEVAWWPPEAAIQAARDGTLRLFPPTAVCLAQLAASGGLAAALAAPRDLSPVTPAVAASGGEFWLILPPGLEYPL